MLLFRTRRSSISRTVLHSSILGSGGETGLMSLILFLGGSGYSSSSSSLASECVEVAASVSSS